MSPSSVGPPAIPNAFNNRYELQTDHTVFCGPFAWDKGGGGSNRSLLLLATPDASYSTPGERQAAPDSARIQQAVDYLFATATGQPRPNGIRRYRPVNANTFCNIFVNDITRILHCEMVNNPANTTVAQMRLWLTQNGAANGWQEHPSTAGNMAQNFVNDGHVAVMMWSNSVASDHVALIRPGQGRIDAQGRFWPRVAQAGAIVSADLDASVSFGNLPENFLSYYLHD